MKKYIDLKRHYYFSKGILKHCALSFKLKSGAITFLKLNISKWIPNAVSIMLTARKYPKTHHFGKKLSGFCHGEQKKIESIFFPIFPRVAKGASFPTLPSIVKVLVENWVHKCILMVRKCHWASIASLSFKRQIFRWLEEDWNLECNADSCSIPYLRISQSIRWVEFDWGL